MHENIRYFREQLLTWDKTNSRSFPWRETTDPYHVLIAELMLRRTQVKQVQPVYEAFLARFPTIADLAEAPEAEVEISLRPLGLAWRVANFTQLARAIVQAGGMIPRDRVRLLALPGVGDYVASAVRCIAFGEADTLIDTNTVRVTARYLGFPFNPESRRKPAVRRAVALLSQAGESRKHVLALLDFAAAVCKAPQPRCTLCPMTLHCRWFASSSQG